MSAYATRADVASKMEWDGCILEFLENGLKPEDMPDQETRDAALHLTAAWASFGVYAEHFASLLPEGESE